MNEAAATQTATTEMWITQTKRGPYYYREGYSVHSIRPVRVPRAEAELAIATGRAVIINKPAWH